MIVRPYREGEEEILWKIYYETTHLINGKDYTPEQCERWAPSQYDLESWRTRLLETQPLVVVRCDEVIAFAELSKTGEIGFFYCRHDCQREGAGKLLMAAIEERGAQLGMAELTADVSVTAKQFFCNMGFEVVREQCNIVCGAPAPNTVMRKALKPNSQSPATS